MSHQSQFSRLEKVLIVFDRLSSHHPPPDLPNSTGSDLYAVSSSLHGDLSNQSDGIKLMIKECASGDSYSD